MIPFLIVWEVIIYYDDIVNTVQANKLLLDKRATIYYTATVCNNMRT